MTDLPVWLADWEHECCGEARRVGQQVRLPLALSRTGRVHTTSEPDQIAVLDDGTVSITGTTGATTGFDGPSGPGTLIQSGNVQFAIYGDAPGCSSGSRYGEAHA